MSVWVGMSKWTVSMELLPPIQMQLGLLNWNRYLLFLLTLKTSLQYCWHTSVMIEFPICVASRSSKSVKLVGCLLRLGKISRQLLKWISLPLAFASYVTFFEIHSRPAFWFLLSLFSNCFFAWYNSTGVFFLLGQIFIQYWKDYVLWKKEKKVKHESLFYFIGGTDSLLPFLVCYFFCRK